MLGGHASDGISSDGRRLVCNGGWIIRPWARVLTVPCNGIAIIAATNLSWIIRGDDKTREGVLLCRWVERLDR